MKFYLTNILLLLAMQKISGQQNLIQNADFKTNTNGWHVAGSGKLLHSKDGATTAGTALFQVSESSEYGASQLRTDFYQIPPNGRGKLYFFSFQAKGGTGNGQKIRLRFDFRNADGKNSIQNGDEFLLNDTFQEFFTMFKIAENIEAIQIRFQCGIQAGDYYFDDVAVYQVYYEPVKVSNFGGWEARKFKYPVGAKKVGLSKGASPDVTISIDPGKVVAEVLPTQFGVNSNMRSGNSMLDRIPLYEPFGSFRFPAGSGSNQYFWDGKVPDTFAVFLATHNAKNRQYFSPESFVIFKNNAKGEPTVVVNYFYARYGITQEGTRQSKVLQAARYAAGFVKYLNNTLKAGIKYWEIGNECYGRWEAGWDVNGNIVTGTEYGEDFRVFAEEMKKMDPGIKCGAVLWHDGFDWNRQVLREVKDHADFLIVHHYLEPNDAASAKAAADELAQDMYEIQALATSITGKPAGHYPVAFTEFNIHNHPAITMFNGLYVAEALATMIKSGFFLTNIWVNEWRLENNHSKGLIALGDPGQPDYTPRPTYTPYFFYHKYFGDKMVDCSANGSAEVRAYASTFSSGETGIVVLNYSGVEKKVVINLANSAPAVGQIYWHSVHAENFEAQNRKFFVNGMTGKTVGGGPELAKVPAFTATLSRGSLISLPKYSATYLVLGGKGKR